MQGTKQAENRVGLWPEEAREPVEGQGMGGDD